MVTVDELGWLTSDEIEIERRPSKRRHKLDYDLVGIVWHATEMPSTPGTIKSLLARIVEMPKPDERLSSWHLLITRPPRVVIYQIASFFEGTWHTVAKLDGKKVNECTIGIELANAGRVRFIDGAYYSWPWNKCPARQITEDIVRVPGNGYFQSFPDEQIRIALEVNKALHKWKPALRTLYHGKLQPKDREDPGPLFPREKFEVFDERR